MAKPQIFLSYARVDAQKVEALYERLSESGFKPWIDRRDILPGEIWKNAIKKAIRSSDFVLICLSTSSVEKRGMIQKEIREALAIWEEKLEDDIYLIPVRLEICDVPESLTRFQYVDWFEDGGLEQIVRAMKEGLARLQKSHIDAPSKEVDSNEGTVVRTGRERTDREPSNPIREIVSTSETVDSSKVQLTRRIVDILGHEMQLVPAGKSKIGEWGMTQELEMAEFFMDRFPVSNKDYEQFILETKHSIPYYNAEWARDFNWMSTEMFNSLGTGLVRKESHLYPSGRGDHPVVLVSWLDAQAYCKWRSQKTGLKIRLPTADEWERAARGNEGRRFPWGDNFDPKRANLRESRIKSTTPISRYASVESPFEVADLIGNVWEWTFSERPDYPEEKVLKGGSWKTPGVLASSWIARNENIDYIDSDVGFRCVTGSIP